MGRPAERGAPAPAHQPVADIIVDRDQVPGGRRIADDGAGFRRRAPASTRSSASISRIHSPRQAAMPALRRGPSRSHAPSTMRSVKSQRDLARAVGAAVEHDDELVGESQARQAIGELRLFVMRDDQRRQARQPGAAGARQSAATVMPPRCRRDATIARRRLDRIDRQAVHQRVGGAVVEARARTSLAAASSSGPRRCSGPTARIASTGLGPNRAEGRRARRRGDVHQPGIVADEQGAAPQHRGGGQQIDPADEIDDAAAAGSAASSGSACAPLMRRRQAPRPGLPGSGPSGAVRRRASSAKRSRAPLLAAPIRGRADRQDRAARRHQRARRRGRGAGASPQTRARRRVETEQPRRAGARDARRASPLADDPALAGAQAARPAPSRANRRRGPSGGRRPRAYSASQCSAQRRFSTTISRSSPGTASNSGAATGPAAIVSRASG